MKKARRYRAERGGTSGSAAEVAENPVISTSQCWETDIN
jgi:hypothetical protein